MHVGDDSIGLVAEFKRRKGPAWRRLADIAMEASQRRAAARDALRRPKPLPDIKLSRSRLDVAIEARLAVRSGVRLEDFLRNRLAKYAARLPVALEELPVVIDVDGGEPVVKSRAAALPAMPSTYAAAYAPSYAPQSRVDDQSRWMKSLIERASRSPPGDPGAGARATSDRAAAADALARTADDSPQVPAASGRDARAARSPACPTRHLRRCCGPSSSRSSSRRPSSSGPILAAQGVDRARRGSPERVAVPVGMAIVFALGAAASVFAFAKASLDRAAQLDVASESGRRRRLGGTAAIAAALLAGGIAAAATHTSRVAHVALLAVVPFAGALLLRAAARLQTVRDAALEAALAWDRALAVDVSERARRMEIVEQARAEVARLEAERAEPRHRVRALEQRAVSADRAAAERTRLEAHRLERLAESLAGALELDRYAFLRLATEATHDALARPVSRLERSSERLGVAG
jgi:hypothetical protein